MGLISRLEIRAVVCLLISLSSGWVWGAELTRIPAPCFKAEGKSQKPRLDVQSCQYLFSAANPVQFLPKLESYFSKQMQCYYEGFDASERMDGAKGQATGSCQDGIPLLPKSEPKAVVCSLNDGEDTQNHLKENCGRPSSSENINEHGKWETAQFRGLWIQALKYFRNQVLEEEIKKTGGLNIHPRCTEHAKWYLDLFNQSSTISDKITQSVTAMPPEVYSGGVNFCGKDQEIQLQVQVAGANGTTNSIDIGKAIPKSAACYLAISRDNKVLMFSGIARCEVWARMNDTYTKILRDKGPQLSKIVNECMDQAGEIAKKSGEAAGKAYYKSCYEPKVRQFFRDVVQELIPGKFQSMNSPSPQGFAYGWNLGFPFFMVAGFLRKKKAKGGRKVKPSLLLMTSSLILACLGSGSGCPAESKKTCVGQVACKVEHGTEGEDCENDNDLLFKKCCAADEYIDLKQEYKDNYNLCIAQCGGANCVPSAGFNADEIVGDAGSGAEAANTAAANLAGVDLPLASPSGNPTDSRLSSSGATAIDGHIETTRDRDSKGPSGPSQSATGANLKKIGGGGGGSSGAVSGSSSLGGTGVDGMGAKPHPGTGSSGASAASESLKGGSEGAYASGGAVGGGAGSSRVSARVNSVEGGGEGTEAVNFGPQDSDGFVKVEDPEDYFTRTGLEQNIFKVVHERYHSAASRWVNQDIQTRKK